MKIKYDCEVIEIKLNCLPYKNFETENESCKQIILHGWNVNLQQSVLTWKDIEVRKMLVLKCLKRS